MAKSNFILDRWLASAFSFSIVFFRISFISSMDVSGSLVLLPIFMSLFRVSFRRSLLYFLSSRFSLSRCNISFMQPKVPIIY